MSQLGSRDMGKVVVMVLYVNTRRLRVERCLEYCRNEQD
jgi:hypothetical protein